MSSVHLEKTFEQFIQDHLGDDGWTVGDPADWNRELALDSVQLFAFIQASQPKEWAKLVASHGANVEEKFLARLTKELDSRGTLDVLRRGVEDLQAKVKLCFFKPAHGLAPEAVDLYAHSRVVVTRQVHYDPKSDKSIDLVLAVNGLPVATAELKSQTSGQNVKHAIHQYQTDRDPRLPLFAFKKRALVHFAVDTDEVWMTTRLAGTGTRFLPFNRGVTSVGGHTAAGNPVNPDGHRTAYLWEEVWARDSWLDIIERFIHLEKIEEERDGKLVTRESIIFPRYHQLDATRRLVIDAKSHGPGHRYLVQHSAGSGKSNTIAWLAYHLASLHGYDDKPVFDTTIVISDRRVLDKQLRDTIYQFEHKAGVVQAIEQGSTQLAEALIAGTKIIITTLQKFPFVMKKIDHLGGKHFAIVIDEAHSSQTGEAAHKLKKLMEGAGPDDQEEDAPDGEDTVVHEVKTYEGLTHVSHFAFTATPKAKTIALFGTRREGEDRVVPFHTYSMRQAIEEQFIVDVLQNYTTYKTFYRLEKKGLEDPEVETGRAGKAIARFVELHPYNIAQKVQVILDHFATKVAPLLDGEARAMVVTRSRIQAVKYKLAFDKYIKKMGLPFQSIVAFSGTVTDDMNLAFTEVGMNHFNEKELPEKFNSGDYRVLLVAEKYQTGFDQPLLHTMYVDKRLDGVKAVQTLSRLNRMYPGKDEVFVLDFVNDAESIRQAFLPYYEQAYLEEETDPNLLFDLKTKIMDAQILWTENVEAGWTALQSSGDETKGNAALNAALDPPVERFKEREKTAQEEFRNWLGGYVRLYAYLLHIIPFADLELLKLYDVGRFLLRKLPRKGSMGALDLDDQVALRYYHLTKTGEHHIALSGDELPGLEGPTAVGETTEHEVKKSPLSKLIERINDVFGADLGPEAILTIEQVQETMISNDTLAAQAKANSLENYRHGFDPAFLDALADLRETNARFFDRAISDDEFRKFLADHLRPEVYKAQRGEERLLSDNEGRS